MRFLFVLINMFLIEGSLSTKFNLMFYFKMAALKSPFSGENMNLQILIEKIEKCDYQDLPDNLYSFEVNKMFWIDFLIKGEFC